MKRKRRLIVAALAAVLCAGCVDDLQQPSFISVGAMTLVPPAQNPLETDAGFYTSNIVAAYVVGQYPGRQSVDTIGLFRLPFTIPVMYSGEVEYLQFYPAVPQSGMLSSLPYYTFYTNRKMEGVTLKQGDTLRFDTLQVTTHPNADFPLLFCPFEPIDADIHMDSVEWVRNDPEGACTGSGYVKVHVAPDTDHVDFAINMHHKLDGIFDFYVADASKVLYMEFDVKSDVEMSVIMTSRLRSDSAPTRAEVMRVKPTSGQWRHFYVNLGRTWSVFNYYDYFSISFSALNVAADNVAAAGGDVMLDNIKVITTKVTQ